MEILNSIILGIIQGITEWLPVSSTGHMILADEFLHLNVSPAFKEMFLVVIQLGSILAVLCLYWKKLIPTSFSKTVLNETFSLWTKIIISCIPAAIVGLLFDEQINELFYNYQTVAIMLVAVGVTFLIIEDAKKSSNPKINNLAEITYKVALWIGIFQLIAAVFPGTSRSGATIIGALLFGVSRTAAAEYTFLLAVPVMFGASLLKLSKFGLSFSSSELAVLLVGSITAFIVSIFAIRFLIAYVKKHDFKVFGYYRIILGVIISVYFLLVH